MSNFLLMRAGYEPVSIQAESRARYIAAIRAFQGDDDPYPFVAFFCLNLAERLEKVLGLLEVRAYGKGGHEAHVRCRNHPQDRWEALRQLGGFVVEQQVIDRLNRALSESLAHGERRRVLFWHDVSGSFSGDFGELARSGVIESPRAVFYAKAEDGGMFELKRRILRDECDCDFLIYTRSPRGRSARVARSAMVDFMAWQKVSRSQGGHDE